MQQIGVFGASFNPPTLGHQDVISQVASFFDEIILVPSLLHAFGKNLVPYAHRIRMLAIFIEGCSKECKVTVSDIEEKIALANPEKKSIYTFDVLSQLEANYFNSDDKPINLNFIIGPDNAKPSVWRQFYRYQEIEQRWPLMVVKERIAIRSTMVREQVIRFASQPSQLKKRLQALVLPGIGNYILENHLYETEI